LLLERHAEDFDIWLMRVAKKAPAKALALVISMADFVVPRLRRAELTGPGGGAIQTEDVSEPGKLDFARRVAFILGQGLKAKQALEGVGQANGQPSGSYPDMIAAPETSHGLYRNGDSNHE
jgi:hypothetical protein